ncbi:MAG: Uma2 family endonuclease [Chloroflexota bacterium]
MTTNTLTASDYSTTITKSPLDKSIPDRVKTNLNGKKPSILPRSLSWGQKKFDAVSLNGDTHTDLTRFYGPNQDWPRTVEEASRRWKGIYTSENAATILAVEPITLHNGWLVWQRDRMAHNPWPQNILDAYERGRGPYTIDNVEIILDEEPIELYHGWLVWQFMTHFVERRAVENAQEMLSITARHIGFGQALPDQLKCILKDGEEVIPDASIISWERAKKIVRPHGRNKQPKMFGCPELVIEGRSRSNTRAEDKRKRTLYFANGVQIVWDLDDKRKKIWVYHSSTPDDPIEYSMGDEITCELMPGWKRKIADIFAEETSAKIIAGEVAEEWQNEGIAIGKEEGREEGIAIGKEEGREEGIAIGTEKGVAIGKEEGREEGIVIGKEEGREEGIAIGKEQGIEDGVRQNIIQTLPMWVQMRFGQPLPDSLQQRLHQLDLETLQTLQSSLPTSPTLEVWTAQL